MDNTPSVAAQPLTILNGGVEITVKFIDGRADETVKVRQIKMRHMGKYGSAQGDEGVLIELFTGKPAEWVDNLTQESEEEIVILGDKLNIDPFFRWSTRRLSATENLLPLEKQASSLANSVSPSVLAAALALNKSST